MLRSRNANQHLLIKHWYLFTKPSKGITQMHLKLLNHKSFVWRILIHALPKVYSITGPKNGRRLLFQQPAGARWKFVKMVLAGKSPRILQGKGIRRSSPNDSASFGSDSPRLVPEDRKDGPGLSLRSLVSGEVVKAGLGAPKLWKHDRMTSWWLQIFHFPQYVVMTSWDGWLTSSFSFTEGEAQATWGLGTWAACEWLTNGFHRDMHRRMIITWPSLSCHWVIAQSLHYHHMMIVWSSHDDRVIITWSSYDHHMLITRSSRGYRTIITWASSHDYHHMILIMRKTQCFWGTHALLLTKRGRKRSGTPLKQQAAMMLSAVARLLTLWSVWDTTAIHGWEHTNGYGYAAKIRVQNMQQGCF